MLRKQQNNGRVSASIGFNSCKAMRAVFFLSIGLNSLFCHADTENPQQHILSLLKAEQPQQAFQLATSSLEQWEGDPEFDYALAMAAKAAGELQLAVFAFERVLNRQPDSFYARYYLAVTYFELYQLQAAQNQFELLQQSQAEHQYRDSIANYLEAIHRRLSQQSGHWQNWLQLGVGVDSNANNGVEDEFVNIPWLGNIRLFEQSREIESAYSDIQAQLLYAKPLSQQSAWYAGASLQSVQYSKSLAWDRTYYSALAGYRDQWQNLELDFSAFYRPLRLDGDSYLEYSGLVINGGYPLTASSRVGASVSLALESYQQVNHRDKEQFIAALWFSKSVRQVRHKFVLRVGTENARASGNQHIDRDLWGASYLINWRINGQTSLSGKFDYLDGNHQAVEPLFQTKRKTELTRLEARLNYLFLPNWQASITVSHINHNSNLILYDYQRTKAMASVRYSF